MNNFKNLLAEYNNNINDASKKLTINVNTISTFDFIKETDFFEKNPLMYDDKIWWRWDDINKRWYIVDDVEVILDFSNNFILQGATTSLFHSNLRTAILNALKQAGLTFKKHFKKEIKPTWIVFRDCIVDIETGEVFDHDFIYFAKNPIPYNFLDEDNFDTSKFDKLFNDWVVGNGQDETWIQTLYELVAYSMLPDYPLETIFCLHGDGSNGKSSFIKMLINFLGQYNCSATELSLLSNPNSRFETTALQGKLVCLMSELDDAQIKNTSLLKKLTGNKEIIRAEYKNKGHVEFINYAKIIMSTNVIPDTADKTDGFYRRWLVIDFPNKFEATNGDVLKNLTDKDYSALARKSISVLKEILQKNTFTNLGSIKQRRDRYEEKSNPLKKFIDEQCVVDPTKDIPVFEFFDAVSSYFTEKGYRAISKSKLSRLMKENGFEVEVKYNSEHNKSWRYYIGININSKNKNKECVYDTTTNKFRIIGTYNFEDKLYTFEELKEIIVTLFKTIDDEEIKRIISEFKKIGDITEVKSNLYKIEFKRDRWL